MLKKLLLFVVFLLVAVVAVNYLAFSPKFEYRVEREMAARPEAIVATFQDLRTWDVWSPWSTKEHPEDGVTFEYSGEPGPGMTWTWSGGKRLGDGHLTITRVSAGNVDYEMTLRTPVTMTIEAGLELAPAGDTTRVVWWSRGEQDMPGVGRIMNKALAGKVKQDYARALEGLDAFAGGKR